MSANPWSKANQKKSSKKTDSTQQQPLGIMGPATHSLEPQKRQNDLVAWKQAKQEGKKPNIGSKLPTMTEPSSKRPASRSRPRSRLSPRAPSSSHPPRRRSNSAPVEDHFPNERSSPPPHVEGTNNNNSTFKSLEHHLSPTPSKSTTNDSSPYHHHSLPLRPIKTPDKLSASGRVRSSRKTPSPTISINNDEEDRSTLSTSSILPDIGNQSSNSSNATTSSSDSNTPSSRRSLRPPATPQPYSSSRSNLKSQSSFRRTWSDSSHHHHHHQYQQQQEPQSTSSRPDTSKLTWRKGGSRPQTTRTGIKPHYGVCSLSGGFGPTTKQNQDGYMVYQQGNEDRPVGFMIGVMDGHGEHGHHVSDFVQQDLGPRVLKSYRDSESTEKLLQDSFHSTADALTKTGIDVSQSGSTAVSVFRRGHMLFVANTGDSRAVLGRKDGHGGLKAIPLTKDHKPSDRSELERIRKAGGHVEPTRVPGYGFQGPARVWKRKQKDGGLALSRALGDTWLSSAGVIPTPDVIKHVLHPSDCLIVLGSDGVWDQVSNFEAVNIAHQNLSDPRRAASSIARLARQRWVQRGQGYVDDITALVYKL